MTAHRAESGDREVTSVVSGRHELQHYAIACCTDLLCELTPRLCTLAKSQYMSAQN